MTLLAEVHGGADNVVLFDALLVRIATVTAELHARLFVVLAYPPE